MASFSSLVAAVLACCFAPQPQQHEAHAAATRAGSQASPAVEPLAGTRAETPFPLGQDQDSSHLSSPASSAPLAARVVSGVERVEIAASDDKRPLIGSFWAPKTSGSNVAPGVVLVHQPGRNREDLVEIAVRLHKQGFAVLSIDLRGHGESVGHDKPWTEVSEEEQARIWTFAVRDVKGSAAWLQKQPGVHSSNVSLVGDRGGCTLVVRHATRDENVRAIVLVDPPREQMGFNLARDLEVLAGLPTLIAASKDTQTSAQAIADESAKANDGLKYVEIALLKGMSSSAATQFDKNLPVQITKFLADKTMLRKSK